MSKSQNVAKKDLETASTRVSIDVNAPIITLINVLEVAPERQKQLANLLEKATDEVMRHLPGFISANLHCSLDGTHVANYAQWRSLEDFERMLSNPDAQAHIREATSLARAVPVLYRVNSVHVSSGAYEA
jgi:heme-degrading monooxygenase HmoA